MMRTNPIDAAEEAMAGGVAGGQLLRYDKNDRPAHIVAIDFWIIFEYSS